MISFGRESFNFRTPRLCGRAELALLKRAKRDQRFRDGHSRDESEMGENFVALPIQSLRGKTDSSSAPLSVGAKFASFATQVWPSAHPLDSDTCDHEIEVCQRQHIVQNGPQSVSIRRV